MIVISRQGNEKIAIGDGIIIEVIKIRGDKVILGIDSPEGTTVQRREIYEAIQRESDHPSGEGAKVVETPGYNPTSKSGDKSEVHNITSYRSQHYGSLSGSYLLDHNPGELEKGTFGRLEKSIFIEES